MNLYIALDEAEYTDGAVVAEIRAKIGALVPKAVTLVYIGEKDNVASVAAAFSVAPSSVTYVGPSVEDLRPAWWWAWVYSANLPQQQQIGIASKFADKAELWTTDSAQSSGPYLLGVWRDLRKRGDLALDRQLQLEGQLVEELARCCPRDAKNVADALGKLMGAWKRYAEHVMLAPNQYGWKELSQAEPILEGVLCVAKEAAELEKCAAMFKAKYWNVQVPWKKALLPLVDASIPYSSHQRKWKERLEAWSALLFSRATVFRRGGWMAEAFGQAWRALETYAYAIGLDYGFLFVSADGAWSWSNSTGGLSLPKEITSGSLLGLLEGRGFGHGALKDQVKKVRAFRNASFWGHGWLGAEESAADQALTIVRKAIVGFEGTGSKWNARVTELVASPPFWQEMKSFDKCLG